MEGEEIMRIQGKRIWIGGQFVAAQLEIEKGTIDAVITMMIRGE